MEVPTVDAKSEAAAALLDWDPTLHVDKRREIPPGPLPAAYDSLTQYTNIISPLVVEEGWEGLMQSFPVGPTAPLLLQYRGTENVIKAGQHDLLRVTFFWGRREQQEFEDELKSTGMLPETCSRSSLPVERSVTVLALQPSIVLPRAGHSASNTPVQPCMTGLVVHNSQEGSSGGAATIELLVHQSWWNRTINLHQQQVVEGQQRSASEARARFEAKQKWREKVRAGVKRFRQKSGLETSTTADGDEDVMVISSLNAGNDDDNEGRPSKRAALDSDAKSPGAGEGSGLYSTPVGQFPDVWYCMGLGNAVTSLRELEALYSLRTLHPTLLSQLLHPGDHVPHVEQAMTSSSSGTDSTIDPRFDRRRYLSPEFVQYGPHAAMNESQIEAIEGALQSDTGFALIQGPPGTGKSTTILTLLNALHLSAYARYHEVLLQVNLADGSHIGTDSKIKVLPPVPHLPRPAGSNGGVSSHCSSGVSVSELLRSVQVLSAATADKSGMAHMNPQSSMRGCLRHLLTTSHDIVACLATVSKAQVLRPRVLVTAPSNTAVDGILLRLIADGMRGARLSSTASNSQSEGAAVPSLEVYRPVVRRVGEGAGLEVKAAPGGVHVEAEVDRLLALANKPEDLAAWSSKLHRDRSAIIGDLLSKRQWLHAQLNKQGHPPPTEADITANLAAVAGKAVRAVEAYESTMLKIRRAELLASMGSVDPRDANRMRADVLRKLRNSLLEEASIVFATTSSAAVGSIESFVHEADRPFSIVVVDEAAQATETSTLIPLRYGASQVILVGDPQQLPATILSQRVAAGGWDTSLMARLARGGTPLRMLRIQYRCHPDILCWPAEYFYSGRLRSSNKLLAGARAHCMHNIPALRPVVLYDVRCGRQQAGPTDMVEWALVSAGPGNSVPRAPTGTTGSMSNPEEARVVVQLLRALAEWRSPDGAQFTGTVGVIAFYRAQVTTLVSALLQLWPDQAHQPPFVVDIQTVDGFQGQERDVIILSCVRTVDAADTIAEGAGVSASGSANVSLSVIEADNSEIPVFAPAHSDAVLTARTTGSAMGFVDDPRRMNVALTRARYACWVVGQVPALRTSVHWRSFVDHCVKSRCAVTLASHLVDIIDEANKQLKAAEPPSPPSPSSKLSAGNIHV